MKPRVLLIPNVSFWILGDMAREIMRHLSDRFEFYFASEPVLLRRADLFRRLLGAVEVVHALNESAVPLVLRAAGGGHPPLVTWIHHVTRWSPRHQAAVEASRLITACTGDWARRIRELSPRPVEVLTVPHGVDLELFRPLPPRRRRYGIPEDAFVLGFVASKGSDRDGRRKGLDTLWAVLERLAPFIPRLHVAFTSEGWEPEIAELRRRGVSAGATGYLRKSQLPGFYACLDAYLMTSRVEGGPVTVLEAMACARPVVATRVGLVPRVLRHGVEGFSAEPGDAEGLAQGVLELWRDAGLRREMGARARRRAQEFPWSRTLEPLAPAYEALARLAPPRRESLPAGLADPRRLHGAVCAADAFILLYNRLRRGELPPGRGLRLARELLAGRGPLDLARGLALAARPRWLEAAS